MLDSSCPRPCAQALILRLAPILGPLIGSAFIIGLYMAARLVRGDLTDRMKMMNQVGAMRWANWERVVEQCTALKEASIVFTEGWVRGPFLTMLPAHSC